MTESEMAMSEKHGFSSARNNEPQEKITGTFDLRNLKRHEDETNFLPPINLKDLSSLNADFMTRNHGDVVIKKSINPTHIPSSEDNMTDR